MAYSLQHQLKDKAVVSNVVATENRHSTTKCGIAKEKQDRSCFYDFIRT